MGISPIFVRFAAADVGPFASAFWRVALSLPVVYAWMVIEERRAPADAPQRSYSGATILAGLAFSGDLFFWHLAILNTTVANATFFATTAPLFVILIVWLVLKQRVSKGTIVGLLFCLMGGGALIGQSLQVDPARIRGDLFGIGTAFFFGLYFLAVGRARASAGAARVTFEAGMVTAAVLLVIAVLFDTRVIPPHLAGDRGAHRDGVHQPGWRPGAACGCARPAAAGVLIPGDFPGGDRRGAFRLADPERGAHARAEPRRRTDSGGIWAARPKTPSAGRQAPDQSPSERVGLP